LPESQLIEQFERLCVEAADIGTNVGYEIMPVDPNVETLDDALAFAAGPDNGGLFIDIWHVEKMDISDERLSRLDRDDIVAVEIIDGYSETDLDFAEETVNLRKLPGEGEFDIAGFVGAVREAGFDGPWGVETLSEEYRRLSMDDAFNMAYDSARQYL